MQPIVNGLQANYDSMAFTSLNANSDGQAAFQQLNLRGHPAIVIFDAEGNEVYRGLGIIAEDRLQQQLDNLTDR